MAVLRPPTSILAALRPEIVEFVRRVKTVRGSFGISSWWRSVEHNRDVGGNAFSQHLLGLAVDTTPTLSANRAQLAAAFRAAGLVAIDEGDHIHVQRYPAGVAPRRWYQLAV